MSTSVLRHPHFGSRWIPRPQWSLTLDGLRIHLSFFFKSKPAHLHLRGVPDPVLVDNTIDLGEPPAQIPECHIEAVQLISEDLVGMSDPVLVDNTIYLARPPAQIPECYKEAIQLISEDLMGIFTAFGIPYMIIAKLAGQGYVEPMDLSMR